MSIANEIARIKSAKETLRQAICSRGATLDETSRLEDFAQAVEDIEVKPELPEVNVTPDTLLSGATALNSEGVVVTGSIENTEPIRQEGKVVIPAGYLAEQYEFTDSQPELPEVNVTPDTLLSGATALNSEGVVVTGSIGNVALEISGNSVFIGKGYVPEAQAKTIPEAVPTLEGNVVTVPEGYIAEPYTFELASGTESADIKFACMDSDGVLCTLDMSKEPPVPDGNKLTLTPVTIVLPSNISDNDWYTPLTITAVETGSVSLMYWKEGTYETGSLSCGIYYRKSSQENWKELYLPTGWLRLAAGEQMQLRTFLQPTESDKVFSRPLGEYFNFSFTNQVKVTGNIMSLGNFADFCTPYCFDRLFAGCSTMIQAPRLPAVKLAAYCYREMFEGCTGLVTAPELPAAELAKYCYSGMFKNCTSLNEIKVNFTSWDSTQNNTWDWLKNTSATGTFIKPEALPEVFGEHEIPENWQVINISNEDN